MEKKIIIYMNSIHCAASIHDISEAIKEPEVDVLGVLNVMVKKGTIRMICVPLEPKINNSVYYLLYQ